MEAGGEAPFGLEFATVERGWDPEQVRQAMGDLVGRIAQLERRLERAEGRSGEAGGSTGNEPIVAKEEAAAIIERARRAARHTRLRAEDDRREILLQARKDALEVIKDARREANEMLRTARAQEAGMHDRVRELQGIVRRTESLLRAVAEGRYGQVPAEDEGADIEVVLAAEQARVERRLQSVGEPEPLPPSVQRLLEALKGGD